MSTAAATGLEGVVVAETELSDVDGERGRLIIRGYEIEDLVGHISFESACALLWSGHLPTEPEADGWRAGIAHGRHDAFALLPSLGRALDLPDGMDALRAAVGQLSASGRADHDVYLMIGATAVFAAAWARRQKHEPPVGPRLVAIPRS